MTTNNLFKIKVDIIRASNIPKMDWNGLSDTYVTCKIAQHTHRTETIKKSLKPEWNESFEVNFNNLDEDIIFYVKGKKKIKKK